MWYYFPFELMIHKSSWKWHVSIATTTKRDKVIRVLTVFSFCGSKRCSFSSNISLGVVHRGQWVWSCWFYLWCTWCSMACYVGSCLPKALVGRELIAGFGAGAAYIMDKPVASTTCSFALSLWMIHATGHPLDYIFQQRGICVKDITVCDKTCI